jgi:hypothetical protein
MIKPEGRHRRAIRATVFLTAPTEPSAATTPPAREREEIQKDYEGLTIFFRSPTRLRARFEPAGWVPRPR